MKTRIQKIMILCSVALAFSSATAVPQGGFRGRAVTRSNRFQSDPCLCKSPLRSADIRLPTGSLV